MSQIIYLQEHLFEVVDHALDLSRRLLSLEGLREVGADLFV